MDITDKYIPYIGYFKITTNLVINYILYTNYLVTNILKEFRINTIPGATYPVFLKEP